VVSTQAATSDKQAKHETTMSLDMDAGTPASEKVSSAGDEAQFLNVLDSDARDLPDPRAQGFPESSDVGHSVGWCPAWPRGLY